jgi:hypothetical protein
MVAGAKPKVRNPVMTLVVPIGAFVVGAILMTVAGILSTVPVLPTILSLVAAVAYLAGTVIGLMSAVGMLRELQNYTQDAEFVWWWLFIPCLGTYFALLKVPEQVNKAKQKAGIAQTKPARGIVFYVFLWLYALANDLNDIAQS